MLTNTASTSQVVNDIHSRLQPTRVAGRLLPTSAADLVAAVRRAARERRSLSVCGGRHAMGAQQFGTDTLLVDMQELGRVLAFDSVRGHIEVEAGIRWPELVAATTRLQNGSGQRFGIAQKQTGADRLSLGGALAANVHGRGLALRPFVGDIEAFTLVDAHGDLLRCSRSENSELFRLAIGGYGLFGIVYSITLRLTPRQRLERRVDVIDVEGLIPAFEQQIAAGALYGDFQFAIDEHSQDYLRRGVFSCYHPVAADVAPTGPQRELSPQSWEELLFLAHTDKAQAFKRYADHYLATHGQRYWSDTHQLGVYLDDYHERIDARLGREHCGTEVITEIYVPRAELTSFLDEVRSDFRHHAVELVYGTIRLIERDDETVMAWAKERYACVIFNLHVEHTPAGGAHAAGAFRRLIDMAIRRGGSYYLTYHRHATRAQVESCYPQFAEFLAQKRAYDPEERFQSDWYRHYRRMFA